VRRLVPGSSFGLFGRCGWLFLPVFAKGGAVASLETPRRVWTASGVECGRYGRRVVECSSVMVIVVVYGERTGPSRTRPRTTGRHRVE